uniref:Sensory neuron membrane protein 1 n=1 Tax=Glossina brevipalpis TaxID=37001 RepID=A0A1A9WRT6_9MUSC
MHLNRETLLKKAAIAFSVSITVGFLVIPKVMKFAMKKMINLSPGTDVRELWSNTPFPLHFYIYVFNITNADELVRGGKPNLQEVGPFVFDEWKSKYDLIDDPVEDTVDYHMRNTYIFNKEKSAPLTGEEMLTVMHPLIVGAAIMVQRERAAMMDLVVKGLKHIFTKVEPVFTLPFMDMFFRGFTIDCSSEEFESKAVCSAFYTGEVKQAVQVNATHFSFSLLGTANHSDAGHYRACRGVKNIHKMGKVILFDDEPELDVWPGDNCNEIVGTDGTVFPPFLKKEQGLWAFSPELCRSLGTFYTHKESYAGMPASHFTTDLGDLKNEPDYHCFCNDPDDPDSCPPKGTMDLQACLGGPLIASLPHFYSADPKLLEGVNGLSPNEHDHAIYIFFELLTGTPFKAGKRLQFNMDLEPVEAIESLAHLPRVLLPLFWVEEGVALNKTYTNMLKHTIFLGKKLTNAFRYTLIILSILGFGGYGYMRYNNSDTMEIPIPGILSQKNKIENVKPVTPTQNGRELNDSKKSPSVSEMDLSNNRPESVERY